METNGLNQDGRNSDDYHSSVTYQIKRAVPWTMNGLKVTRLRLVSNKGFPFWDVSYCHGFIGDEPVRVALPFGQLPKQGTWHAIVEAAKRDNVFAKGLGILDCVSTANG